MNKLIIVLGYANGKCQFNEIEQCRDVTDESTCVCKACHKCGPGYGLYPRCGGKPTKNGTVIQCLPCITGSTYSDHNGIGPCRSCNLCIGTKILQPCTPTQPAKCSTECADGYELDSFLEVCVLSTKPPQATTEPSTLLPATEFGPSELSTKLPRTPSFTESFEGQSNADDKKKLRLGSNAERDKLLTVNVACSVIGVIAILLACVVYFNRKSIARILKSFPSVWISPESTNSCSSTGENRMQMKLSLLSSEDGPGMRLTDISEDLKRHIAIKISKQGPAIAGFREIGLKLDVEELDLDAIELNYHTSHSTPGEGLLTLLSSSQPDLKVKEFIEVLKSLNLHAIVAKIYEELSNISRVTDV